MRQQKRGLQLQNPGVMRKENNREKRKEIRWTVQLQSPIFLIRCGKNPVIYDDPAPLSSFQCPSSIQSLNLAHFNSVLGPKKNPSNQSRELGQKSFSRSGIPAFNTRYSNGNILSFWYWNQAIPKPKFIYASQTTTLMKDSKWDKFILNNRIATKLDWKPSRGKILYFHTRFQTGISWVSDIRIKQFKSSNSYMCPGLKIWWRSWSEIKSF